MLPRSALMCVSLATCHLPASRSRPRPEWISSGSASRRSWLVSATGAGNDRTTSASSASDLAASTPATPVLNRSASISPAA
jgi:hypothetical protein